MKIAAAVAVLMEIPEGSGDGIVSLAQAWEQIERVIPRGELTAALEQIIELVPDDDGDDDADWRAELVKRYGSVTGFLGLLAQLQFGAVGARLPVLAAVRRLPELVGRRRVLSEDLDSTLVAGSWRRLVFSNPELPAGVADHRAYVLRVLEQLHRGLGRRELYVEGADRWGDPRARLLDADAWQNAKPRALKALELAADPDVQLQALSVTLDDAYRQVAGELASNGAEVIDKGKLRLEELGPAPEPPGLQALRGEIARTMPRVDFPRCCSRSSRGPTPLTASPTSPA